MLLYFVQLCKMDARELIYIVLLIVKVSTHQAHYYQQPSMQSYTYSSSTYGYSSPQTSLPLSSTSYASPYSPLPYSQSCYFPTHTTQCSSPQPYDTTASPPIDASSYYYQPSQSVSSAPSSPVDVPTYIQSVQTAAPSSLSSSYYQNSPPVSAIPHSYITTTSSSMDVSPTGSISYLPSSQPSSYFTTTSSSVAAPSPVSYIQSNQPISSCPSSYGTATSSPVEVSYLKPSVSSTEPSPYGLAASSSKDLSSMASVSYIQANPSAPSPVKSTYTNRSTFPPPNHSFQPKCTIISGGKTIEVPCYTLPTEPKKASSTEVLPVETPIPIKESLISYQHPPVPNQNLSSTINEPIPPKNPPIAYPCPLCSALKNSVVKDVELSIMPPPAPSPLIPGILNEIPSTFPPQKQIIKKKSPIKSNLHQKSILHEGPLIYLPVSDEGKLLEKLLTGFGY